MILCDTAPLFCSVDRSQLRHQAVKNFIESESSYLITTWACFTEAMYLCLKRGEWSMQAKLGQLLLQKIVQIGAIEEKDYPRLLVIMEKYKDRPMDLADATLVVTAENLKIKLILTFDSDFFFYRINDSEVFEVIDLYNS
jgi:predicted nucleic acid-binding protein